MEKSPEEEENIDVRILKIRAQPVEVWEHQGFGKI